MEKDFSTSAMNIKFSEFAKCYCGTDNKVEQIEQLKDALIDLEDNEISEAQIKKMYDQEVTICQEYFEPNDYWDIEIAFEGMCFVCMSLIKII